MTTIHSIGVIAYPRCGEQDTLVPWEILKSLAWVMSEQGRTLEVKLVALEPGNVTMQMGLQVVPESVVGSQDLYDLLLVPGGMGSGDAARNQSLLDLVRRHYTAGKVIATNCSGISVLHRAGILEGRPVTCPPTVSNRLAEEGVQLVSPRRMWVGATDDRIWTTVGGSGVHGSAVAMIAHYFGEEYGRKISIMWDTMGALGDHLFATGGPEYGAYPAYEREVQGMFEDMLLPRERRPVGA